MTQPSTNLNLRGAVDLSGLAKPAAPRGGGSPNGAGGSVPGPFVVDVTEATFADAVRLSAQVPVVVDLWADWCQPCKQLSPVLEKLAREYGGRFQLAKVDVDANQQIAAAFQVQSIPSVVALVGGQPVPLFQGAYPEAQVRQVLDELLRVAAENGVAGVLTGDGDDQEDEPEPEAPLPPLHAQALAAIERGDLDAAADAYRKALKENPGDDEARAALAQVELLARTQDTDAAGVLAAADAAGPTDVDAQLAAADVEMAAGRASAAFDRLIAVVRATAGADRERVRLRLLDLFAVAGATSPEVNAARRQLASALY